MHPCDIVLDRTRIAEAAANYEALALVNDTIRFTDQIADEDRKEYAIVDNQWYEVACYARDLDDVAPALPKIRVAFCPTTVEAEKIWTDPTVHVVVVRELVFGPLEMDGRSRSTAYRMTVTQEKERWITSASRLYVALRVAR